MKVWKFHLIRMSANGRVFVHLPAHAKPISAGIQADDVIVVWATVPDDAPDTPDESLGEHRFIVVNTGYEFPLPDHATFLGTVTTSTGIVWHVWDGDA